MILVNEKEIKRYATILRTYILEIAIVGMTYGLIFLFKTNQKLNQQIQNNDLKELDQQKIEKEFFLNIDLKLLKINDSLKTK